jgi:Glycosyltransferase family 87
MAKAIERLWWSRACLPVLIGLATVAVVRFAVAVAGYGIPAWFDEELNPLVRFVTRGQPITAIDLRQYGVVTYLVFDPAIRLLGPDFHTLAGYGLVPALAASIGALALVGARLFPGDRRALLVLALAWFAFEPLLYVVSQRMVDSWQLFFISLAFFWWTSASPRWRLVAGVPLALATLTKLLPALLLVYLLVRSWRTGLVGLATVVALLGVGQLRYGPAMGFAYPFVLLASGGDTVANWSTHYENNSVRGLLYKAAAGFRLDGDTTAYVLSRDWLPLLNAVAYAAAAALVALLLWVAWRSRGRAAAPERRGVELGLAIVTMLLVSPHTAQDYTVAMLPVLALWAALWSRRWPSAWPTPLAVSAAISAVLIGVFVPMSVMSRLVPIDRLLLATNNANNALFTTEQIGGGIGAWDFFGFPGLGLLLALGVSVVLERRSRPLLGARAAPARTARPPTPAPSPVRARPAP